MPAAIAYHLHGGHLREGVLVDVALELAIDSIEGDQHDEEGKDERTPLPGDSWEPCEGYGLGRRVIRNRTLLLTSPRHRESRGATATLQSDEQRGDRKSHRHCPAALPEG